jgi:hypothetical protein
MEGKERALAKKNDDLLRLLATNVTSLALYLIYSVISVLRTACTL